MDCYVSRRNRKRTIISDSFNRSNGHLGTADSGQAWLTGGTATTAWIVSSNVAKRASATTSLSDVAYIDSGTPNVTVSADITMSTESDACFLVARMSGTSIENSVFAFFVRTSNLVLIGKYISGSYTNLSSVSFSLASGVPYACSFVCDGNNFSVSVNGTVIATVTDDNVLKSNTRVGMLLTTSGSTANDYFDNFKVVV